MSLRDRLRSIGPWHAAEAFAAANLAFLAVDVGLAHTSNEFVYRIETLPVAFSIIAALVLVPGLVSGRREGLGRFVALVVGAFSIVVGVTGMVLHLESTFFRSQTLHELVYTAPFVAPLAYVGLGLLLLLDRMEDPDGPAWGPWVVMLALGGFVGNFALSALDHAQNGFYRVAEWIPVGAAGFGVSFLLVAVLWPKPSFLRLCFGVLGLEVLVGVAGAILHVTADVRRPGLPTHRIVYGAPIFAPLLFADLALLAAIGLWAMLRKPAEGTTASS
jgi:hypothetical protein